MSQEFKIGDRVIIADMDEMDKYPHPFGINESMKKMSGMKTVITNVIPHSYSSNRYSNKTDGALYRVDADNGMWGWANIMFKPCIGNLKVVEEEL